MTGNRTRTWELRVDRERVGSVLILTTSGRIAQADAASFRMTLTDAVRQAEAVIVDLSAVDYVSDGGVAALHDASMRNGGKLVVLLCGLQQPVRIALDLAGVLDTLSVEPTRSAALERLNADE